MKKGYVIKILESGKYYAGTNNGNILFVSSQSLHLAEVYTSENAAFEDVEKVVKKWGAVTIQPIYYSRI